LLFRDLAHINADERGREIGIINGKEVTEPYKYADGRRHRLLTIKTPPTTGKKSPPKGGGGKKTKTTKKPTKKKKPSESPSVSPPVECPEHLNAAPAGKKWALIDDVDLSCTVESTSLTTATFSTRLTAYKAAPTTFTPAINTWNTQEVDDMTYAFMYFATANPNVRCWNVAKVTKMENMFDGATQFDIDISAWNVEKVTNMAHMFADAGSFNKDISDWTMTGATELTSMFLGASNFKQNLCLWNEDMTSEVSPDMFLYSNCPQTASATVGTTAVLGVMCCTCATVGGECV